MWCVRCWGLSLSCNPSTHRWAHHPTTSPLSTPPCGVLHAAKEHLLPLVRCST